MTDTVLCNWLTMLGIDPSVVPRNSRLTLRWGTLGITPTLEYERFVRDAAGLRLSTTANEPLRERCRVRIPLVLAIYCTWRLPYAVRP